MALEVGRLVARIDIEGSFEQKLAAAKAGMEDTARSAQRLDEAVSKAGASGRKLDVPSKARDALDKTASSASRLGDGLSKAAESGKRLDVSNAAESKIVRLSSSARDYGVSLSEASAKGRSLNVSDQPRAKLAETASVADQVNSRFQGLGVTMKSVVGMAGGAAGLGAVMTKGWDRITAIDTAQGKLRGLGHEAAGVETIMGSALDSVRGTSYGLGDAATIAANAVAAGITPGKELTKYLSMTADASAIAGVSLGEMGRILNQVQTGQAAYAGDLSQLADRGIPIYQWIADEAGIAAAEVKKLASTGQISSEMLFSAIQNNIGGAAKEVGNTLTGSLANAGAAFGRLGASVIDPFKDQLLGATSGVTDFADSMTSMVGPAASLVAGGLGEVASVVGKIPAPILTATAALVTLQQTGLGPKMAGAASTAVGAVRDFGESALLAASYARDGAGKNGLFATSLEGIKGAGAAAKSGLGSVVDMLGGPWMIGIAGATMLIADFIAESKSASEAQQKLTDLTAAHAAAQTTLAEALMQSNGALDDQAMTAAADIIQKSIDAIQVDADRSVNVFNDIGAAIRRNYVDYDGWVHKLSIAESVIDQNAYKHEIAKLELQAMGDAAAEAGIEMGDFARVAAEGGPKWDQLRQSLLNTGSAGKAVVEDLEAGRRTVNEITAAATEAEIASTLLADAFRVMANESATAEDKTNALKAALDALAGDTLTADEATGAFYETMSKLDGQIDKLSDGTGSFTRELADGGLAFDMTSEKGRGLQGTLKEMRDAIATVRDTGAPMADVLAANEKRMEALSAETGLTTEQLWKLAERVGFFPDVIEMMIAVDGAGAVAGDLAIVASALKEVEKGAEVEVKNISDDALKYLQEVGWEAQRIPGTPNIRVTAQTVEAQRALQATIAMAANLDNADPNLNIDNNAEAVIALLGITEDKVNGLPDGSVEIEHGIPGVMELLDALGIKTAEPKNGVITINDADVDRARQRVEALRLIETQSTHTVMINTVNNASMPDVPLPSLPNADGGFLPMHSFADGGTLPANAVIQRPVGTRGLVQWAEAETEGEAFIPLARSKRPRSVAIWKEVGRRLGELDPRPDASRVGDSLWNLAAHRVYDGELSKYGIEEDNPLSRLGLAAFDARRGTNRAIASLMPGLFGNHSPIGYNDGEFWLNKFADGGIMASGLINFAKGVEGKPYVWGGVNWGDCSGAVSALANYVSGRSPFGSRFATASQREGLLARGFVMGRGKPGDLRIGWKNGGPGGGHTSATLPNGVNFEMGGARGNGQYGGGAAGADDPQYTDHAHFPMERFADIDAALGEGAMAEIAALLGTGNPYMAPEADTRTQREKNIDAIVAEGQRRGMSDRDIQIALMTAEQESGIRVLNNPADAPSMAMAAEGTGYDGTSTGIFQQQNNGAWGTLEDRMDPTRSAGMFYDALAKIENRDQLSLTQAAQKVQGSAHPDAYAKHEATAAELLSASKSRLSSMGAGGTGAAGGKGLPVYVTNMPAGGFSGGGGGGGGGGSYSGGGDAGDVIKEGSIADVLMRAAGLDPTTMFPAAEQKAKGKEKRFDDTKIFEKEGDIEAAKEQARIAQIKLEELKNKTNAKGERVAPSESALAAAELRASEAERKVQKLEHDLRELRLKSQEVREHNASIGVDVENYANGGFHGLENHSAHIAPNGSYRIFGESETGGEAYIPLASHKRARSTAIWLETGRRLGYGIGAGINLVGSVLTGNGLDTGWGGPGLGDLGIDTNALKDSLAPGLNAEAEKAGQQVAAVLQAFLNDVQKGVSDTMRTVDDQQRQLRQQYARAMI